MSVNECRRIAQKNDLAMELFDNESIFNRKSRSILVNTLKRFCVNKERESFPMQIEKIGYPLHA